MLGFVLIEFNLTESYRGNEFVRLYSHFSRAKETEKIRLLRESENQAKIEMEVKAELSKLLRAKKHGLEFLSQLTKDVKGTFSGFDNSPEENEEVYNCTYDR